jgi:hypothetical protein
MGGDDFFKTTDELDSSDGRVGGQKSVQTISLKRGDDKPLQPGSTAACTTAPSTTHCTTAWRLRN